MVSDCRDRPDGQPRRMMDASSKYGFKANTSLEDGLGQTIDWYETQRVNLETQQVTECCTELP